MYNFYNFYSLTTPETHTFPGAFRAYEMKTAKKKKKKKKKKKMVNKHIKCQRCPHIETS